MGNVPAYEIGAVFFLVVMFMVGTMTRGIFSPDLFKNVKLTAFVVTALLVGFLVYRNLPDISSLFKFDLNKPEGAAQAATPKPAVAAIPVKHSSTPRPAVKVGEVRIIRPFEPEPDPGVQAVAIPIAAVADPPQSPVSASHPAASQPSAIAEARQEPTQESGNRAKRAIKAVSRFFGHGHEQYRPGQSVPQNASTP